MQLGWSLSEWYGNISGSGPLIQPNPRLNLSS